MPLDLNEMERKLQESIDDGSLDKYIQEMIAKKEAIKILDVNIFNKIINYIKEFREVDSEYIAYHRLYPENKIDFTEQEFSDVCEHLQYLAGDPEVQYVEDSDSFPQLYLYFKYNDFKFIYHVIVGQGAISSLYNCEALNYKFDEEKAIIIK